ncbi:YaaA family protein [Actinokineospora sp. 24-640]
MLVLLPPSETKADGGSGAPLDLAALSFPELTPVRDRLVSALAGLDPAAALSLLGLSERQADEVGRNARLRGSPTMPAIRRYTGVLYDALAYGSFTRGQRSRAGRRLAVASALFGVLRADDPIPAYRFSGGTVLPGIGGLRGVWRADLEKTLSAADELVVDLRSGAYAALATVPHAVTVRVVTEGGATVSHFNKAHKGRLAAALACAAREPGTTRGLVSIAKAAGLRLVPAGPRALDLVVEA